jgi:hypothetical protein
MTIYATRSRLAIIGDCSPSVSRIGAALEKRELSRAAQRSHPSGMPEFHQLATLAAALARLAVAEDLNN